MAMRRDVSQISLRDRVRRLFLGPQWLAFLPALVLGAFWLGGEAALMAVALGLPFLMLLTGGLDPQRNSMARPHDAVTGLPMRDSLEHALDTALVSAVSNGNKTACYILEIEDLQIVSNRFGQSASDALLERLSERLRTALRDGDLLCRLGDTRFGIALAPVPRFDLETAIQMASRLQSAVEEPVSLEANTVYISCSIGVCMSSRSSQKTGKALINNASIALTDATRSGPSAIRAYSIEMGVVQQQRDTMINEAIVALEDGQIIPWFQPQVSTDTGQVTGFEALARWSHPERGIIPPSEFLPALEQAGQMERLGEVILYQSLTALNAWAAVGINVPCVAVNFTGEELRNPRLPEKIGWDLDRFDLTPDRLTIEILETVVAGSPEDTAARNIHKLAEMGCRIDLDDFGTGHASISAIRSFAIERIKIDRSFITQIDSDPEQQRMVSAILTMAERLDLETLAEGIETSGEHAMLAQLGCSHVQGFGIARPMPFEKTVEWINMHNAKLAPPPTIGRHTG